MHLMRAPTRRVIFAKIAAAWEAELTHHLIAQGFPHIPPQIQRFDPRNHGQDIDHGLRKESRYGCASDVLEIEEQIAEGASKSRGFFRECLRPRPVIWKQLNAYGLRIQTATAAVSARSKQIRPKRRRIERKASQLGSSR
jgi:hypothetical protein